MGLMASTVGRESDEDESLGLHNISLWSEIFVMQNMIQPTPIYGQNLVVCPSGRPGNSSSFLCYLPLLKFRI